MKKIAECSGMELIWKQPNAFKMEYVLSAGDQEAATLQFRSSFGTFATAQSADGCWTFRRVGFFQTRVTIRDFTTDIELAEFHNNTWTSGGSLVLPNGRVYKASTNFWQTRFQFYDPHFQFLFQYSNIGGFFHSSAKVIISPAALAISELPWMLILAWYLSILMRWDAAAAASVANS
jgi:hypothetical protein